MPPPSHIAVDASAILMHLTVLADQQTLLARRDHGMGRARRAERFAIVLECLVTFLVSIGGRLFSGSAEGEVKWLVRLTIPKHRAANKGCHGKRKRENRGKGAVV